ncbi:hypothetical protein MBLNU13_g00068t1 [Cladosporium sp. NU13]
MSHTRGSIARTIAAVLPLILPASCTSFLNHTLLLGSIEDPRWYEDNVPFMDLPDQQIQDVYYYRWQSYKEHLFYTGTENGYISTEFLRNASRNHSKVMLAECTGQQDDKGIG